MRFEYPIIWPAGWPRNGGTGDGGFKVDFDKAVRELAHELELLGVDYAHLSTDYELRMDGRPRRDRPGKSQDAVLYFERGGKEMCIPCDRFGSLKANVRAIGLTIESIRRMERYGTSQMVEAALAGFTALPETSSVMNMPAPKAWHEILGVSPDAPKDLIDAAYKVALKKAHPDGGGSVEAFHEVQRAYKEAKGE